MAQFWVCLGVGEIIIFCDFAWFLKRQFIIGAWFYHENLENPYYPEIKNVPRISPFKNQSPSTKAAQLDW